MNLSKTPRWLRGPALAGLLLAAAATAQAGDVDVGVSIGIHQPGVYGRIDIGRFPQPQVIVQQPVLVVREAVRPAPIYLHVPPGHRKHWRKHCRDYGACGTPVYFVQERWYQEHVVRHGHRKDRRDDRWDDRWDDRRGPGQGHGHENFHGKGHGKGHGRGHD